MSLQRPTITRKTIRTRALLALCLSGSMALAACGSGGKDSATATEGQNATAHSRPKTLYLINPSDANAWAKAFAESYTKVLEDGGVKVTRLQNNFDPVAESQQFTQAISQKPVPSPCSPRTPRHRSRPSSGRRPPASPSST